VSFAKSHRRKVRRSTDFAKHKRSQLALASGGVTAVKPCARPGKVGDQGKAVSKKKRLCERNKGLDQKFKIG